MAKRLDPFPEYQEEEIRKYRGRGFRVVRWADRDLVDWKHGKVFAVYLSVPVRPYQSTHAYISFEELEVEFQLREDLSIKD